MVVDDFSDEEPLPSKSTTCSAKPKPPKLAVQDVSPKLHGELQPQAQSSTRSAKPKPPKSDTQDKPPALQPQAQPTKKGNQEKLKNSVTDGSASLLKENYKLGSEFFKTAIDLLHSSPSLTKMYSEEDIILIKYCYSKCCVSLRVLQDVHTGIKILKEVDVLHPNISFPLAYYMLGVAYVTLNKFKEAKEPLEKLDRIIQKKITIRTLGYPGFLTTEILEESNIKKLKVLLGNLLATCKNPPAPDATCRHPDCDGQEKASIYYSDPGFLGFVQVSCHDRCRVQFHTFCWNALLDSKHITRNKDFLNTPCLTPDCKSVANKIRVVGPDGEARKEFVAEASDKKVQKSTAVKIPPQKQSSLKQLFKKKRERSVSRCSSGPDQEISKLVGNLPENSDKKSVDRLPAIQDTRAFTDIAISKKALVQVPLPLNKTPEKKQIGHKIKKLRDASQEQPLIEIRMTPAVSRSASPSMLTPTLPEKIEIPYTADYGVDPDLARTLTEYLEDLIRINGPVKLDCPSFFNEVAGFPTEAQELLCRHGGVEKFIALSDKFDNIGNIVLLRHHYRALELLPLSLFEALDLNFSGRITKSAIGISRSNSLPNLAIILPSRFQMSLLYDRSAACRKERQFTHDRGSESSESSYGYGAGAMSSSSGSHGENIEQAHGGDETFGGKNRHHQISSFVAGAIDILKNNLHTLDDVHKARLCLAFNKIFDHHYPLSEMFPECVIQALRDVGGDTVLDESISPTKQEHQLLFDRFGKLQDKCFGLQKEVTIFKKQSQDLNKELLNINMRVETAVKELHCKDKLLHKSEAEKKQIENKFLQLSKAEAERLAIFEEIQTNNSHLQESLKVMEFNVEDLKTRNKSLEKALDDKVKECLTKCVKRPTSEIENSDSNNNSFVPDAVLEPTGDASEPFSAPVSRLRRSANSISRSTPSTAALQQFWQPLANPQYDGSEYVMTKGRGRVAPPRLPPQRASFSVGSATNNFRLELPYPEGMGTNLPWDTLGGQYVPKTRTPSATPLSLSPMQPEIPKHGPTASGPSSQQSYRDLWDQVDNRSQAVVVPSVPCNDPLNARAPRLTRNVGVQDQAVEIPSFPNSVVPESEPKDNPSVKSYYERMVTRLKREFPTASRESLIEHLTTVRNKNGGSLSGLLVGGIVEKVRYEIFFALLNKCAPVGTSTENKLAGPPKNEEVKPSELLSLGSSYSVGDVCPICTEDLISGDIYVLMCKHSFHKKCIKNWYSVQETCPTCRKFSPLDEDYPALPRLM